MTAFADLKGVCDSVANQHETGGPDGASGNIIFVWAELQPNFQGQPYCAGGVSWTWKHAGHPFPAIDHPWGFSYCPDGVNWFKSHGLWDASGHYAPGDTVFYDWVGQGISDHTGIVIADDGSMMHTFEFNTSPGVAGSQANGGGCYYRDRPHGPTVLGVGKSSLWLVPDGKVNPIKPTPKPVPRRVVANPYPVPVTPPYLCQGIRADGPRGTRVRFVQWAAGAAVDGVWGPQTTHAVEVFQKFHALPVDGVVGPQTLGVMRRITR